MVDLSYASLFSQKNNKFATFLTNKIDVMKKATMSCDYFKKILKNQNWFFVNICDDQLNLKI